MKEVTIKYKDARVLELLKSISKYFDFSISEEAEVYDTKKDVSFNALKLDTLGYKFNRNEANER